MVDPMCHWWHSTDDIVWRHGSREPSPKTLLWVGFQTPPAKSRLLRYPKLYQTATDTGKSHFL